MLWPRLFALNVMLLTSSSQDIQKAGNYKEVMIGENTNGRKSRNGSMGKTKRARINSDSGSAVDQPLHAGEE